MKIRIFEAQRALLEREHNAKAQLKRLTKGILPIAMFVLFLAALGGYFIKLIGLWALIAISCAPLIPILLLVLATRIEGKKRSWTLTDQAIKMSDGFFMPLRSIVSWEVDRISEIISKFRITVRNKGKITRSIEVLDDDTSREFMKGLESKCGPPSPKA